MAKAILARDAQLWTDAFRLVLAAYVVDEPGTTVNYQWYSALKRPAMAVRFGAGVSYSGTKANSIRSQLRANGSNASSQLNSIVGDLAGPLFDQLDQAEPMLPPLLSIQAPATARRNQNQRTPVEVLGEGDRNTLLRVAMKQHVDVMLFFEVRERSTRTNKKSKSVTFSAIDVWRGKDLLTPQPVNYLKRQLAQAEATALYEDPVDKIARNFHRFVTETLQPKPIPAALRKSHAKKRVASLVRRRRPDPLAVLAEVKFYRERDLLSVQDQMLAYQRALRNEASGTELLAGAAKEKRSAIDEWIPLVSPDALRRATRNFRDDDDD